MKTAAEMRALQAAAQQRLAETSLEQQEQQRQQHQLWLKHDLPQLVEQHLLQIAELIDEKIPLPRNDVTFNLHYNQNEQGIALQSAIIGVLTENGYQVDVQTDPLDEHRYMRLTIFWGTLP